VKPYPIPVLEGEAAEEFIKYAEKPPTALQKKVMKRAEGSFSKCFIQPKKQVKKKKQVKRK
jgi:hypothetical protein